MAAAATAACRRRAVLAGATKAPGPLRRLRCSAAAADARTRARSAPSNRPWQYRDRQAEPPIPPAPQLDGSVRATAHQAGTIGVRTGQRRRTSRPLILGPGHPGPCVYPPDGRRQRLDGHNHRAPAVPDTTIPVAGPEPTCSQRSRRDPAGPGQPGPPARPRPSRRSADAGTDTPAPATSATGPSSQLWPPRPQPRRQRPATPPRSPPPLRQRPATPPRPLTTPPPATSDPAETLTTPPPATSDPAETLTTLRQRPATPPRPSPSRRQRPAIPPRPSPSRRQRPATPPRPSPPLRQRPATPPRPPPPRRQRPATPPRPSPPLRQRPATPPRPSPPRRQRPATPPRPSPPPPATSDPAETLTTPPPATSDPAETLTTPAPATSDPAATLTTPPPATSDPAETLTTPAPATSDPAATLTTPAPATSDPAETLTTPPPATDPAPTPPTTVPAASEPASGRPAAEPSPGASTPVVAVPAHEPAAAGATEAAAPGTGEPTSVGGPAGGALVPVAVPRSNGHDGTTESLPAVDEPVVLVPPGAGAPGRRQSRPQRDGVIVPLRVPLGTRLKAGVGLCALVVVIGDGGGHHRGRDGRGRGSGLWPALGLVLRDLAVEPLVPEGRRSVANEVSGPRSSPPGSSRIRWVKADHSVIDASEWATMPGSNGRARYRRADSNARATAAALTMSRRSSSYICILGDRSMPSRGPATGRRAGGRTPRTADAALDRAPGRRTHRDDVPRRRTRRRSPSPWPWRNDPPCCGSRGRTSRGRWPPGR